jgi:hypothetical protein
VSKDSFYPATPIPADLASDQMLIRQTADPQSSNNVPSAEEYLMRACSKKFAQDEFVVLMEL